MYTFWCIVLFPILIECQRTYPVASLDILYPPLATEPVLPQFSNLLERIRKWNPDEVELSTRTFSETIQHFNYSNPAERDMVSIVYPS